MDTSTAIEIDDDTFGVCPVCDGLIKTETLEHHVEAHFEQEDRSGKTFFQYILLD